VPFFFTFSILNTVEHHGTNINIWLVYLVSVIWRETLGDLDSEEWNLLGVLHSFFSTLHLSESTTRELSMQSGIDRLTTRVCEFNWFGKSQWSVSWFFLFNCFFRAQSWYLMINLLFSEPDRLVKYQCGLDYTWYEESSSKTTRCVSLSGKKAGFMRNCAVDYHLET
jgi:hypothetical protein